MNNKKVFDFIGYRKVLFLIPIVIAVITVIFNCIFGIEMAIEFKGGTMLTYSYTGEIDTNAVKKTVEGENYGAVTVTTGSSMNSSLEVIEISFSSSEGLTADKQTALSDKLQQTFKDNSLTLVNSQDVNPTSGTEFFLKCLVAVLFSFILLVIYIAFRFKKIGGLSAGVFALVALVHDCFMVYAVFVFCRFPIDANFMAVVLTVLGNSINNTIVVYDRIRENRNLYGNSLSLKELDNTFCKHNCYHSLCRTRNLRCMRNLRRNLDNDICYSYDGRSYLRYLFFTVHLGSPVGTLAGEARQELYKCRKRRKQEGYKESCFKGYGRHKEAHGIITCG